LLRVVMGGPAQPLEVGRRSPVVPPAIRRAVIARDRRCRFPGCERPHPWCESHHVVPWAKGGPTGLSNLLLLCRRHHGLVHEPGGFGLKMTDGTPVFRRPDGTVLEDRSPPAATSVHRESLQLTESLVPSGSCKHPAVDGEGSRY
jgi:hypothetical protein